MGKYSAKAILGAPVIIFGTSLTLIFLSCSNDPHKKTTAAVSTDILTLSPSMADSSSVATSEVTDCAPAATGGFFCSGNVINITGANDIFIVKLTSGIAVDTAWGSGGYKSFSNDKSSSIKVDGVGNIYVAGEDNKNAFIMKLKSDGSYDTTFGNVTAEGTFMWNRSKINPDPLNPDLDTVKAIAMDTSYIYLAIESDNYVSGTSKKDIVVLKLNLANGTQDASFAAAGVFSFNGSASLGDSVKDMKLDGGSLYLAGSIRDSSINGTEDVFTVIKLTTAGPLDTAFNTTGIKMINISTVTAYKSEAKGLLVSGSTLYVTGMGKSDSNGNDMILAALNTGDGAFAGSFNSGTFVKKDGGYGKDDTGKCLLQDSTGIYVGGYIKNGIPNQDRFVWIYDTAGTFLNQVSVTPDGSDDEVNSCSFSADGTTLVLGGYIGSSAIIWKKSP